MDVVVRIAGGQGADGRQGCGDRVPLGPPQLGDQAKVIALDQCPLAMGLPMAEFARGGQRAARWSPSDQGPHLPNGDLVIPPPGLLLANALRFGEGIGNALAGTVDDEGFPAAVTHTPGFEDGRVVGNLVGVVTLELAFALLSLEA